MLTQRNIRTRTHASSKQNPQSHAEKHTNYETMEAEAENWALLLQAGGGEMTQHESGTNYKLAAGRNMYWPAGLLGLA